jgi:hypothetical protein
MPLVITNLIYLYSEAQSSDGAATACRMLALWAFWWDIGFDWNFGFATVATVEVVFLLGFFGVWLNDGLEKGVCRRRLEILGLVALVRMFEMALPVYMPCIWARGCDSSLA